MGWRRLALVLAALNLGLVVLVLARVRPLAANEHASPGVLRGSALELIDEQGRVRAEIKVLPADPDVKMPNGTKGSPETVQLRLIDSKGSPHVKLAASEDGSGLVLGGEKGYVQILSRGTDPYLKIVTGGGQERLIKP
ncbi:MAG TPA: hypothetical protein VKA54_21340 [Gemmatimonadaceae bacterium]|nr:hypothetical protein [Gemmatimonadaceae bacterium]